MFRKIQALSLLIALGLFSSMVEAVELGVPNIPGPYIGVTLIEGSKTSVRINFVDNSDNEDGFRVFDGGDINIAIPANDENANLQVHQNISNLVCDRIYEIKVVAENADGASQESDTRAFSIEGTFGVTCDTELAAPGPYLGVTAIEGSKTSVRVNFLDNSDNEDGFRIFDGDSINVEVPANDEIQHPEVYQNLTGLVCDKVYIIKAVAHKDGVDSAMSDERDFSIYTTFNIECDNRCSAQTDTFTYENDTNASLKADILFVMDDSGSMGSIQMGVAHSVSSTFGNVMTNFGINWKATVIGTERGRDYLTRHIDNPSINDIAKLSSQLRLGTYGYDEVGFLNAYQYLSNADILIRNDSKLSIVYISDEIAHTTLAELGGIVDINDSYFVQNNIKVSSIIQVQHQNNTNLAYNMANVTGGIVADINAASFDILMTKIAENAAGGASTIELSETPCDISNIEVLINGIVVTSGWVYNANSNSIIFDNTSTIQDQDQVTVNYTYLQVAAEDA